MHNFYMFISFLYTFRATMCPSSGKKQLYLCDTWYLLFCMDDWYAGCIPDSKGKAVPLQARSGPESVRKLRFPDFMTMAQDGGKVVSLTHRPPLPPGITPGTHFC